jgi:hypothetical protein
MLRQRPVPRVGAHPRGGPTPHRPFAQSTCPALCHGAAP